MSLIYKKNKRLETMILSILDLNPKFIDLGLERIQKLLLKLIVRKKITTSNSHSGHKWQRFNLIFIKKLWKSAV